MNYRIEIDTDSMTLDMKKEIIKDMEWLKKDENFRFALIQELKQIKDVLSKK